MRKTSDRRIRFELILERFLVKSRAQAYVPFAKINPVPLRKMRNRMTFAFRRELVERAFWNDVVIPHIRFPASRCELGSKAFVFRKRTHVRAHRSIEPFDLAPRHRPGEWISAENSRHPRSRNRRATHLSISKKTHRQASSDA